MKVKIDCNCGEKHLLFPGISSPVYWCNNNLKELKVNDTIEIEGVESEKEEEDEMPD